MRNIVLYIKLGFKYQCDKFFVRFFCFEEMSGLYQTSTSCIATRSSKKIFYCCEGYWETFHFLKIENPNQEDVIAVIDNEQKIIGPQQEIMLKSSCKIKINSLLKRGGDAVDQQESTSSSRGCAICHGYNR